jgi:hypothetical protein
MTIANKGNVGIGTPFPYIGDLLNIHIGNVNTSAADADAPPAPFPSIKLSMSSAVPSNNFPDMDYYQCLRLSLSPRTPLSNSSAGGKIRFFTDNTGPDANHQPPYTQNGTHPGGSQSVERMTIANNGNIGISNTSPSGVFQVGSNLLTVLADGTVGLGVAPGSVALDNTPVTVHTQTLKLAVNGLILCKELIVKITQPPWPDYVFQDGYKLMPLADLEKSVKENKHLPDLPSKEEIETGGVNVVDLEAKLVKKVEELTLYVIELKKENDALKSEVALIKVR